MIDFKEAPFIDPRLIEFLENALSADHLIHESTLKNIQGLEQLGFIKGARHALEILRAGRNFQENGSD
ncbi:hypothetical protein SPFL3102_03574 [Sporomusaceae bacterium FL31]|nr:hypothetical protein SPFL3101_00431 [Sporomusaceae bacterium FL31]GCE35723.1 hypothetical protein SPFL3102_03574 [Sporomusaceae bacterium]